MLPKESRFTETEMSGVDNASLPLCYMSDYSVLALRVDRFENVLSHLEKENVQFKKAPAGIEVLVDDVARLQAILQLFATHGINAELTDIAAQIYQG